MSNRVRRLALAAAVLLPLGGCFEKDISDHNVLGFFMRMVGATEVYPSLTLARAPKPTIIDTTREIYFTADVGGMSGTYQVTISDGEKIDYGTFSGTTKVKRGRFITVKDPGSDGLIAMVDALAAEQAGGEVTITKARATVTAHQTPGGVEVVYKAKITFSGIVDTGPSIGRKIRSGKLTFGGTYPKPV